MADEPVRCAFENNHQDAITDALAIAVTFVLLIVAGAVLLGACASRAPLAGRVGAAAAACYTNPKICN